MVKFNDLKYHKFVHFISNTSLKYKSTLQQVEKLTQELGGAKELADDDIRALLSETHDEPGGDWSVEELQEKIAVVERVFQVLENVNAGVSGTPHQEMKERIRQWQNK